MTETSLSICKTHIFWGDSHANHHIKYEGKMFERDCYWIMNAILKIIIIIKYKTYLWRKQMHVTPYPLINNYCFLWENIKKMKTHAQKHQPRGWLCQIGKGKSYLQNIHSYNNCTIDAYWVWVICTRIFYIYIYIYIETV